MPSWMAAPQLMEVLDLSLMVLVRQMMFMVAVYDCNAPVFCMTTDYMYDLYFLSCIGPISVDQILVCSVILYLSGSDLDLEYIFFYASCMALVHIWI